MTATIVTDSPFTPQEQNLLRTLALIIIPPSAEYNLPGANDTQIFADILSSAGDNVEGVRTGLQAAQRAKLPTVEFSDDLDLTATAQTLLATTHELQGHPDMAALVSLLMQCYYRDDRVMESLDMEARPPFPKGYEVSEGDWSMLESVQQRGKIWRDA